MLNLPTGVNKKKLISDLKNISWEASDILLDYSQKIRNQSLFIETKNNNEPVTEADLAVNNLIIKNIHQKYFKNLGDILSEENVNNKFEYKFQNWLWILDPLDGTKDFIQNTGNYAMHLALNYKNKPSLGLVLIPARNELWITDSSSVWCENKIGTIFKHNLSNKRLLNEMTIVISKNHRNESLTELIQKIGFKKSITMGSIGCKIASILRGESDVYISLSLPGQSAPKDWDFAAPEVILRNAGGAITNLDNEELTYCKKNFRQEGLIIASSNKKNHKNLCFEIKKIIKEYNLFPLNS